MMRRDARDLLDKLGRREVRYRQFVDSTADMELWPIFEALLRDERVIGANGPPVAAEQPAPGPIARDRGEPPVRQRDPRGNPPVARPDGASLFGQYESPARPIVRPTGNPRAQSIREFLSRLSDED